MEGFFISDKPFAIGQELDSIYLDYDIANIYRSLENGGSAISVLRTDKRYIPTLLEKIPCKKATVVFSADMADELRKFSIWCVTELVAVTHYTEYDSERYKTLVADLIVRPEARSAIELARQYIEKTITLERIDQEFHRLYQIISERPNIPNIRDTWFKKKFWPKIREMADANFYAELASLYLIHPDAGKSTFLSLDCARISINRWRYRLNDYRKNTEEEFQRMIIGILNS